MCDGELFFILIFNLLIKSYLNFIRYQLDAISWMKSIEDNAQEGNSL
jgi:hypothetical protein